MEARKFRIERLEERIAPSCLAVCKSGGSHAGPHHGGSHAAAPHGGSHAAPPPHGGSHAVAPCPPVGKDGPC